MRGCQSISIMTVIGNRGGRRRCRNISMSPHFIILVNILQGTIQTNWLDIPCMFWARDFPFDFEAFSSFLYTDICGYTCSEFSLGSSYDHQSLYIDKFEYNHLFILKVDYDANFEFDGQVGSSLKSNHETDDTDIDIVDQLGSLIQSNNTILSIFDPLQIEAHAADATNATDAKTCSIPILNIQPFGGFSMTALHILVNEDWMSFVV